MSNPDTVMTNIKLDRLNENIFVFLKKENNLGTFSDHLIISFCQLFIYFQLREYLKITSSESARSENEGSNEMHVRIRQIFPVHFDIFIISLTENTMNHQKNRNCRNCRLRVTFISILTARCSANIRTSVSIDLKMYMNISEHSVHSTFQK